MVPCYIGAMRIAVIGGTGKEGRGLAIRWAKAGHSVIVGSRDPARAQAFADEMSAAGYPMRGDANGGACREAEVVLLSVPYSGHAETLTALRSELAGKLLIDITVPLKPPQVRRVNLPPGRAAALEAQALLETTTRVVAALHHVSSAHLSDPDHAVDCDVLVCGDDEAARATVVKLVADLGLRGLDAGPLENAIALESLTPVLLHLNRTYKTTGGVRFTGIP